MATSTSLYEKLSPSVLADPETYCTVDTCPLTLAYVLHRPTLPGNVLNAVLFGLSSSPNSFLGFDIEPGESSLACLAEPSSRSWDTLARSRCVIILSSEARS